VSGTVSASYSQFWVVIFPGRKPMLTKEVFMTLFIACLLIYHYDMGWIWYAVAGAIWLTHLGIVIWERRAKK
jgi:hypothetical protein